MDYVTIVEIIATILTLIGIPLISIPRVIGMWILVVSTIFWIIFCCLNFNNHLGLLIQSIYVLCFDIIAIYNWKKKGIK